MTITIKAQGVIDGLYVAKGEHLSVFFDYVEYDPLDGCIIFERGDEVVTGKVNIDSNAQLKEWRDALFCVGIELVILDTQ